MDASSQMIKGCQCERRGTVLELRKGYEVGEAGALLS